MAQQPDQLFSATPTASACNALLIFPRFNDNSFWALRDPCRMRGAKAPAPPLGLMTVAALLPQSWTFRLVDRNIADVSEVDFAWADLVLTGGMLFQYADTIRLIDMCRARDVPVAVGGPDPTSRPQAYETADIVVHGEFESVVDAFVAAWDRGERQGRFTAPKFQADITTTPVPRYDLIRFSDYMWVNLQFSRGCPFTCEFCDIIELYGRVPRTKTNAQVLAELDRLLALGYRGNVDFVDDNFIGNKKALKSFLPELRNWQIAHGYPFHFSTEASLNVADDDALLGMMAAANFVILFTGIESGEEATLVSMQKKQNTRRDIAESVHRIYAAGIYVTAGFILGFDTETAGVADRMIALIETTAIPYAVVSLLAVLPNTQLARRLRSEGRISPDFDVGGELGHWCAAGLNFSTARPQSDILRDYVRVLRTIHAPEAYFARLRHMIGVLGKPQPQGFDEETGPQGNPGLRHVLRDLAGLGRLLQRLLLERPGPARDLARKQVWRDLKILGRIANELLFRRRELLVPTWRLIAYCRRTNPIRVAAAISNIVFYLHISKFIDQMLVEVQDRIRVLESAEAPSRREPRHLTAAE